MANISVDKLFRAGCDFKFGIAKAEDLPYSPLPEIAFAGRSNVGKSSLINSIMNRNGLAKTSKNPGCTQQVNFFDLAGKVIICDLPGYGYAKASKDKVEGWNALVNEYLVGRPNLKRVFLLIDSRHGLKTNDSVIMKMLDEAAVSYQVILTKVDKQKKATIEKIIANMLELGIKHTALHPEVLVSSSTDGTGLDNIRKVIAGFVK